MIVVVKQQLKQITGYDTCVSMMICNKHRCEIIELCVVGGCQLLMSTLAANIVNFIHKTGIIPLSAVMHLLVDMVTTDAAAGCTSAHTVCTDGTSQTLVSLCRSMLPENFIRSLLNEISSEMVMLLMSYYCIFYWIRLILCSQKC